MVVVVETRFHEYCTDIMQKPEKMLIFHQGVLINMVIVFSMPKNVYVEYDECGKYKVKQNL